MILLIAVALSAEATALRQVSVQGRCEVKVTPDRGGIQLRSEKTASDPALAVDEVSKKMSAVKEKITKLALKDFELKTTHFQLNEHREWENNKSVLKGYRASLGFEISTSEIHKISQIVAEAAKLGLNGSEGLRTFLSLEKQQAEYLKCLGMASDDAQKKASQLAKSLDARLGEVISIAESPAVIHSPQPLFESTMMDMSMKAKSVAAPPIEVSDQVFSTTLQVSFALK